MTLVTAPVFINTENSLNQFSSTERSKEIEFLFNKFFTTEIDSFRIQDELRNRLITNCKYGFVRSRQLGNDKKTEYNMNFVLNISNNEYISSIRKKFNKEIGFFNFKVVDYFDNRSNKIFTTCYFSEIQLDDEFQGCGLFSVIFNTYNRTLQALNVDIDYLHVKSNKPFTASLYHKKGYTFTPTTEQILTEKFEGTEEYLKDSSVSYKTLDLIEMFRWHQQKGFEVLTSIDGLVEEVNSSI